MEPTQPLNPAALPVGAEIDSWRVLGLAGRGTWGTVYRAEKIGHEHEGPVALKMATQPLDPRFEREGELLSRLRHPNVPGLLERGWWRGAKGTPYPFLVMQWVQGLPLYAWASQPGRTWGEAVRVLMQVASALAATHAVDGVHRDVKGENVWVREDGSAVLLDFGSGYFLDARTLTRPAEVPGTPQYWSLESLRFQWEHRRDQAAHYRAGPADDVYALAMLAWRLMVGRYPEPAPEPEDLGEGTWLSQPVLLPPKALAGTGPELKALILRMFSSEPKARGSAAEVLQGLERALEKAERKAERPLLPGSEPTSTKSPAWAVAWEWAAERRRAVLLAAAAMLLIFGIWKVQPLLPGDPPVETAQPTLGPGGKDAGTSELGDTAVTERPTPDGSELRRSAVTLELPKEPFPGQRHPPCKPPRVTINGGCWIPGEKPPCGDDTYEWENECYFPVMITSRVPTSEPR